MKQIRSSIILALTSLLVFGFGPIQAGADPAGEGGLTEDGFEVTVDGVGKTFSHVPPSESYYTRVSSQVRGWVAPGGNEQFSITFLSMDLDQFDFPSELPPPRVAGKPMDMTMLMASIGFGYVNPDGIEWAGPGKVTVDSFQDGVLQGRFDGVKLPQVDDEAPDVLLEEGRFRVKLR